MIFVLSLLEIWNQTQNLKVEHSSLEKDRRIVQLPEHLVTNSSVVENDDYDHPILPKVVHIDLLHYTLRLVQQHQCLLPLFSVHIKQ